jgi:hypothetical protein
MPGVLVPQQPRVRVAVILAGSDGSTSLFLLLSPLITVPTRGRGDSERAIRRGEEGAMCAYFSRHWR